MALRWTELLETYLPPGTDTGSLAIDYLVSPPAHVDHVSVEFDFDRMLSIEPIEMSGECPASLPLAPVVGAVADDAEDIVRATVVASSVSGPARTGRLFVSTGTASMELRIDALDAGDPTDGAWWALFEPAAGNSRLLIVPAQLDRTTFVVDGMPRDQPGTLALIQTSALERDAATGAIYAPWGFGSDWRRFARRWYQLTLTSSLGGPLSLTEILPGSADPARAHRPGVVLEDGADHAFRTLGSDETTIGVACDAESVDVLVLTFTEVSLERSARTYRAGEMATVVGACEGGAISWPLRLTAELLNGRNGAVMLHRSTEVLP